LLPRNASSISLGTEAQTCVSSIALMQSYFPIAITKCKEWKFYITPLDITRFDPQGILNNPIMGFQRILLVLQINVA
jgi:hypothetical protein